MSENDPLFIFKIVSIFGAVLASMSLIHSYVKNHPEIFEEYKK